MLSRVCNDTVIGTAICDKIATKSRRGQGALRVNVWSPELRPNFGNRLADHNGIALQREKNAVIVL